MATFDAEAYIISSAITYHSKPLPIKSSTYLNKKNINRINITIKNVTAKGLRNALISSKWIFFNDAKIGNANEKVINLACVNG